MCKVYKEGHVRSVSDGIRRRIHQHRKKGRGLVAGSKACDNKGKTGYKDSKT